MEAQKPERKYKKFYIDFSAPVNNSLVTLENVEKFYKKNTKLNGLKDNLQKTILIEATGKGDKHKNNILFKVDDTTSFSKRYIKYLAKKYLKKENLNGYLRVVATSPGAYAVKFFKRDSE